MGPQVTTYVRRSNSDLEAKGFAGSLFMMGSNGGVLSVERTCRQPVALVESGPIGGCIGAGAYAEALGFPNVIAFDMGGTTAKCALVENGRFSVDSVYYAGGYVKGFPIKSSVIDIVEVGSGGGSIAWLDPQNRLHVGPQSAGSTPGPVCYGNGGTEPTVTDANLVLGRLNPDRFLGGELKLDAGAARRRSRAHRRAARLCRAQRRDPDGRRHSVARDRDHGAAPSSRSRSSTGSIRATSCCSATAAADRCTRAALARELSIPTVVIPPEPGNFSAIGMLLADARLDLVQDFRRRSRRSDDRGAAGRLRRDGRRGARRARCASSAPADVFFERHAEMRYAGQRHNIKVPISGLADAAGIRAAFDRDYKRRYGHADSQGRRRVPGAASVGFHPAAAGRISRACRAPRGDVEPRLNSAPVYFGASGGTVETQVYDRSALAPGFKAKGPALIEEYGSTTLVWPRRPLRDRCARRNPHPLRARLMPEPSMQDVAQRTGAAAVHRSDHARGDPARPRLDHQSDRRQYQAHGVQPLHLRIQRFRGRPRPAPTGQLVAQCTGGMPPFVADSVGMAVRDGLADLRPRAAASRRRRACAITPRCRASISTTR